MNRCDARHNSTRIVRLPPNIDRNYFASCLRPIPRSPVAFIRCKLILKQLASNHSRTQLADRSLGTNCLNFFISPSIFSASFCYYSSICASFERQQIIPSRRTPRSLQSRDLLTAIYTLYTLHSVQHSVRRI